MGMSEEDTARMPETVTPSIRAGVIQVFQTRAPRLSLAMAAAEAGVPQPWLETWLLKELHAKDMNENRLVAWIRRCLDAFAVPSTVPVEAIEAGLLVPDLLEDDDVGRETKPLTEDPNSSTDAMARKQLHKGLEWAFYVVSGRFDPFMAEVRFSWR